MCTKIVLVNFHLNRSNSRNYYNISFMWFYSCDHMIKSPISQNKTCKIWPNFSSKSLNELNIKTRNNKSTIRIRQRNKEKYKRNHYLLAECDKEINNPFGMMKVNSNEYGHLFISIKVYSINRQIISDLLNLFYI